MKTNVTDDALRGTICEAQETEWHVGYSAGWREAMERVKLTEPDLAATSISEDDDLGRAIRIRWIDSGLAVMNQWVKLSEMPESVEEVESVGLWMGENDEVAYLGGSRDSSNSNWHNCQLIYKPCILSKEWLT